MSKNEVFITVLKRYQSFQFSIVFSVFLAEYFIFQESPNGSSKVREKKDQCDYSKPFEQAKRCMGSIW